MAVMADTFRERWRSGQHIGDAKPTQVVEIRRGYYKRDYLTWDGDDVDADIPGETRRKPWRPGFYVQTDWVELPGVLTVDLNQDFGQNGMTVATITVENVGFIRTTGLAGVYHAIEQGFLAPFRGYNAPTRPEKMSLDGRRVVRNEWYQLLARMAQVRVWQGYGEPERDGDDEMPEDGGENGAWAFVGLIDDIDPEGAPDRITVTARDHGKMLTDQRIFGWNKSRTINDPVQFMDRLEADDVKAVGGAAEASSELGGYPARFVADDSTKTSWRSHSRSASNVTEWVEVRLPAGRYEEIVLDPAYEGLECFIGIYAKDRHGAGNVVIDGNIAVGQSFKPPTVDGEPIAEGWIDVGLGDVPGEHGGWPYVRRIPRLGGKQNIHKLNRVIVCGDNTILRVGFRNLARVPGGQYRAGVTRLQARHRRRVVDAKKSRVILVDDVADVVKVCLRWAGFEEWEIETTGVRLKGKATFNRSNFLIDPIRKACEQTGYVFFMGDPSGGESIGVPTFRKNRALLEPPDELEEIRDTDLLTGIKVKISEEPLAWTIRVRGKETSDKGYAPGLGGDRSRRVMANYHPPWTRARRMSGVLKHVTQTMPELRSYEECLFACYLIAINEALQAVSAVVQVPAQPGFNLDDQVGILDTSTGMNTRLWISNRSSTFQAGEQASWVMTLGGSLIDTPDMVTLLEEVDTNADDNRWIASGTRGPG